MGFDDGAPLHVSKAAEEATALGTNLAEEVTPQSACRLLLTSLQL
jgi:hypothetical protein